MLNQTLRTNRCANHINDVKKQSCTLPFIILLLHLNLSCIFICIIFLCNTNHLVKLLIDTTHEPTLQVISANHAPGLISDSNQRIKLTINTNHPIKHRPMESDANRMISGANRVISDANRVIRDANHGIRGDHYDHFDAIAKMESLWTMRGLLRRTTSPPGQDTISSPHD